MQEGSEKQKREERGIRGRCEKGGREEKEERTRGGGDKEEKGKGSEKMNRRWRMRR